MIWLRDGIITVCLRMKLSNVGEFAKYKLTIENDTKKDYEIDMGEAFSKKEYI